MENDNASGGNVILVSGPRHYGKTTLVESFLASIAGQGLSIAGILAKGLWENDLRAGFDLVNLADGHSTPLARRRNEPHPQHGMLFDFLTTGFQAGLEALSLEACRQADIVVVDEVGRLEARGEGWAPCVKALLTLDKPLIILIVRLDRIQQISDRFGLSGAPMIDVRDKEAFSRLRNAANRGKCSGTVRPDD